ncbi:MAG TPA: hypothetical protein VGF89_04825 [Steroidobacteraceae bacterium]|jgi:3-hydroxymyristoyl/3-hydroxydecanoyl-(acyl carrier protein) dehydratase
MTSHTVSLCIAPDHPAIAGHFPGFPVVPGVVLLDETLHAIECAQAAECGGDDDSLWHVGTVKYHRAVRPGELLQLEYQLQPDGRTRFELRSADALVAGGTLERRPPAALLPASPP